MQIHGKLQQKYKNLFQRNGYSVKLEVNVPFKKSFYVVDIIAKNRKETVAIEIGYCNENKLKDLEKLFDRVVYISYLKKSKDGYLSHICGFKWKPRVRNPKECPRCKKRLDKLTGGK